MTLRTGWCLDGHHHTCPGTTRRTVDHDPEPCPCDCHKETP